MQTEPIRTLLEVIADLRNSWLVRRTHSWMWTLTLLKTNILDLTVVSTKEEKLSVSEAAKNYNDPRDSYRFIIYQIKWAIKNAGIKCEISTETHFLKL